MKLVFSLSSIFCGIILIAFTSCADVTVTKKVDYASFSAVTGLELTDPNGSSIGSWKQPNQNPGDNLIYPIPGDGNVAFLGATGEEFTKIWVTPASCVIDTVNENIPSLSLSLEIDLDEIEEAVLAEFNVSGNVLNLDLTNLGEGFYKIFFQKSTGTKIYWSNYYLNPNYSGTADITLLDMQCN